MFSSQINNTYKEGKKYQVWWNHTSRQISPISMIPMSSNSISNLPFMINSMIAVNIEPIIDVAVHIDKGAGKLTKVAA